MVLSSKKDMKKTSRLWLVLLIVVSLIPLLDLFHPGLPITHDGRDHVARIANFYQSLAEGNLIPRWGANLNWGYGHPVLMFLYPLPSYLASFFHLFGFSFVNSTKIVFGLGFLLSGIFMYLWIREMWGEEAGFVSGLLYMFAPYRFVDLYVRGAIGENLAFVWLPLICWFVLKMGQEQRWLYLAGGSLSLAALILSHNALSLMFLPLILVYAVYLIYISSKKKRKVLVFNYLLIFIFGLALAAFYWLPAFFEGRFTLRDIVTKGNITGFESFSRLLWSPWSYGITGDLSVQVGILHWLGILVSPFLIWFFWRKKDKFWLYLLFLLFSFWLAVFFILPASKVFYLTVPLLEKWQFAWRFLSLAILPPVIFLGALVYLLPKKIKFLALCLFLLLALFLNKDYWQANDFSYREESFYTGVYPSTTDTGESSPIWSVRFMESYPKAPIEVIDGQATIEEGTRSTTRHDYKIKAAIPTRLVDNTLYFREWQVLIDGEPTLIQFQDPNYRGLITFNFPQGEHQVVVRFQESLFRLLANLVSLGGLIGLVGFGIIIHRVNYRGT